LNSASQGLCPGRGGTAWTAQGTLLPLLRADLQSNGEADVIHSARQAGSCERPRFGYAPCLFEGVQDLRSRQKGAVAVETALASVMFFALLFGVFDFSHVFYCESTLKYAVSQAARFATTGNTVEDEGNPGTQLSREDSILEVIRDLSGFDDLGPPHVTVSAITSGGASVAGAGGPGDVVTVRAQYGVSLLSPYLSRFYGDGTYRFEVLTTFRNEEFPGA